MMKKVLFPILALVLALGLALPMAAPVGADVSIDKSLSQSTASLGDHITVTLDVSVLEDQAPVTVVDTLPDPLKYIAGTLIVTGGDATSTTSEDEIVCTLTDDATYTITFDVQVTSTEAEEFDVTNTATVDLVSDSAELTIEPYAGFEKWIEEGDEEVPMYTDVDWVIGIYVENIDGDDIETMEDVVVKDRLGGDLELNEWDESVGSIVVTRLSGKTEKVHLVWNEIGDLADDDWAVAWLLISTDVNPGQGKKAVPVNEYTEAGPHELNSGAVLKFIDPDTGFQLSAHTPPLVVTAVE